MLRRFQPSQTQSHTPPAPPAPPEGSERGARDHHKEPMYAIYIPSLIIYHDNFWLPNSVWEPEVTTIVLSVTGPNRPEGSCRPSSRLAIELVTQTSSWLSPAWPKDPTS